MNSSQSSLSNNRFILHNPKRMTIKSKHTSQALYTPPHKNRWNYNPDSRLSNPDFRSGDIKTSDITKECLGEHEIEPKFKRCGIIFIYREEEFDLSKVLVVRGMSSNIWSYPKGKINIDEEEEACAIRETLEETGIVVTLEEIQHVPKVKFGRNTYFIIAVNSLFYNFMINDNNEVDKVEWKTIRELRQLDCNKDIRSVLKYPTREFEFHKHFIKSC
jgi:8-oxo-dGTP pyrophosphatase MutT (NUDIX family)